MATNLIENRQIRIFISSTFDDMQAERNMLIKHVYPQLNVEAAKRGVTLMMVDLRWGITAEEYHNGKILEICLNEIENSYPFFIGILGDRYGWQPDSSQIDKNSNLKERYPWVTDDLKSSLSVTEMEMQFGVLRRKTETNASFFIKKTSGSNKYGESADAQTKLQNLKNLIISNGRYPYHIYGNVEEIGEQVKNDFTKLLDKYFPQESQTPLEIERSMQHTTLSRLCSTYIPVEDNFTVLDTFLNNPDSKYLCVTGNSGLGKSALMANWIKRLQQHDTHTIIYHFVGTSETGAYYENILKRITEELCDKYNIEIGDEEKNKKYKDLINDVFPKIPSDKKLIIIIDAVNQINPDDYAKQLSWLPSLPSNVKLVLTTITSDDTYQAITRRNFQIHTIHSLQRTDREKMVTQYLIKYGKKLTQGQLNRIIDSSITENTLVLKTLLNQLILFGRYEELDERIDYYLNAETIPDFFQKVLQRSEEDYDDILTRHALSLIALSRNGMSENEIIDITGCTPLAWSQIYCAFENHFNIKNGLINFAHTYITKAVEDKYLNDKESKDNFRSEIIQYFKDSETPRGLDELPYQYCQKGDDVMLHDFLLDIMHFFYFFLKDKHQLYKYWQKLMANTEHTYTTKEYLELIKVSQFNEEIKNSFNISLGYFSLMYNFDLSLAEEVNKKAIEYKKKLNGYNSYDNFVSYNNLGFTYQSTGKYDEALKYYNKALKFVSKLRGKFTLEVATYYNNIGYTYHCTGKYDKALNYYHKALKIQLQYSGQSKADIARSYNNIGFTFNALGLYYKALKYFNKALDIQLQVLGHLNAETATTYNNIGSIYESICRYDKALEYQNKALEIRLEIFGELNPYTATSYNDIGITFCSENKYDEALEYFKRALKIQLQVLGNYNLETSKSYNNIGNTFYKKGKFDEALKYLKKAIEIQLKLFGELNPENVNYYNNIGSTYEAMCQYDKALEYYNKALKIQSQIYKGLHPLIATIYNNIGNLFCKKGIYYEALKYFKKALEIQSQISGDLNAQSATYCENIGITYQCLNQNEKALEYFNKASVIRESLE